MQAFEIILAFAACVAAQGVQTGIAPASSGLTPVVQSSNPATQPRNATAAAAAAAAAARAMSQASGTGATTGTNQAAGASGTQIQSVIDRLLADISSTNAQMSGSLNTSSPSSSAPRLNNAMRRRQLAAMAGILGQSSGSSGAKNASGVNMIPVLVAAGKNGSSVIVKSPAAGMTKRDSEGMQSLEDAMISRAAATNITAPKTTGSGASVVQNNELSFATTQSGASVNAPSNVAHALATANGTGMSANMSMNGTGAHTHDEGMSQNATGSIHKVKTSGSVANQATVAGLLFVFGTAVMFF